MDKVLQKYPALILNESMPSGRIYTSELIKKTIDSLQKQIQERRLFVNSIPEDVRDVVSLKDVVGLVHNLTIEDNKLMVEFEILNTEKAITLFSKNETEEISISLSPHGLGTIKENIVQDDWELLGFHITVNKYESTI